MKSKSIKCEICEEAEAIGRCRICGRYVCSKHLHGDICTICESALCRICGKQLAIGYCKLCGRIICEDCAIEISNVEYVCVECYRKLFGRSTT